MNKQLFVETLRQVNTDTATKLLDWYIDHTQQAYDDHIEPHSDDDTQCDGETCPMPERPTSET